MTGDDLKRMQDHFLEGAKTLLRDRGQLRPVGFVVTLHKNVKKLFDSGWGIKFIDPATCVHVDGDDTATLVIDLAMDWKRLYHAVVTVWPQTAESLAPLVTLAETLAVDDPYKRVMRPFLMHVKMDEKDVIAATMRHLCEKTGAYASIFQSEGFMRVVDTETERADEVGHDLSKDAKAVESVLSSMETHDFARMLTVPIRREGGTSRGTGTIVGFGELIEGLDTPDNGDVVDGRLTRFLKPLAVAS